MAELEIEPARTALVVIDLQRGIVGSPSAPRPGAEVVQRVFEIAAGLRKAGGTIVFVHVTPSADGRDGLHPIADAARPARGSMPPDWAELVPELGIQPGDMVITKRQWGAFYGTELDLQLRRRGVDTIILCGIATSIGVESTARDAYERGYNQIFVEDAMADRDPDSHRHSTKTVFPRIGRVRSTAEVVAAIG